MLINGREDKLSCNKWNNTWQEKMNELQMHTQQCGGKDNIQGNKAVTKEYKLKTSIYIGYHLFNVYYIKYMLNVNTW